MATAMQISLDGLIEIASYEGVCTRPYFDSVGVLTWGVGHTAAAGPPDPKLFNRGEDQPMGAVFSIFRSDLAAVEDEVNRLVKVPVSQSKFDALCSFQFNTGGLARANLLQSLNRGDYPAAADGFLGWLKPPEIEGRRRKEMALFRDGTYSAMGKVLVFPVSASGQPLYSQGKSVDVRPLLGATMRTNEPMPRPQAPEISLTPAPVDPPKPRPAAPQPAPPPTVTPAERGVLAAALAAIAGGLLVFAHQIADWFHHLIGG